jgi:hypothetical protein
MNGWIMHRMGGPRNKEKKRSRVAMTRMGNNGNDDFQIKTQETTSRRVLTRTMDRGGMKVNVHHVLGESKV